MDQLNNSHADDDDLASRVAQMDERHNELVNRINKVHKNNTQQSLGWGGRIMSQTTKQEINNKQSINNRARNNTTENVLVQQDWMVEFFKK